MSFNRTMALTAVGMSILFMSCHNDGKWERSDVSSIKRIP